MSKLPGDAEAVIWDYTLKSNFSRQLRPLLVHFPGGVTDLPKATQE